ncbi:MAG: hypothetical protein KAS66_11955, partial [Candidatus Omnitrophica bacterium]|nr:hypothetical protein [Candidatus Omnitrophota bacterium]
IALYEILNRSSGKETTADLTDVFIALQQRSPDISFEMTDARIVLELLSMLLPAYDFIAGDITFSGFFKKCLDPAIKRGESPKAKFLISDANFRKMLGVLVYMLMPREFDVSVTQKARISNLKMLLGDPVYPEQFDQIEGYLKYLGYIRSLGRLKGIRSGDPLRFKAYRALMGRALELRLFFIKNDYNLESKYKERVFASLRGLMYMYSYDNLRVLVRFAEKVIQESGLIWSEPAESIEPTGRELFKDLEDKSDDNKLPANIKILLDEPVDFDQFDQLEEYLKAVGHKRALKRLEDLKSCSERRKKQYRKLMERALKLRRQFIENISALRKSAQWDEDRFENLNRVIYIPSYDLLRSFVQAADRVADESGLNWRKVIEQKLFKNLGGNPDDNKLPANSPKNVYEEGRELLDRHGINNVAIGSFITWGEDGVTLETKKLIEGVLSKMGVNIYLFGAKVARSAHVPDEHCLEMKEMHYKDIEGNKVLFDLHKRIFPLREGGDISPADKELIKMFREKIKAELKAFVMKNNIDAIVVQNVLAFVKNIPFALAIIDVVDECGIKVCIDWKHDIAKYERKWAIDAPFSGDYKMLKDLIRLDRSKFATGVLNKTQQDRLFRLLNVYATVLLNPQDYDNPPKMNIDKAKALKKRLGIPEDAFVFLCPVRPVERKFLEYASAKVKKYMELNPAEEAYLVVSHGGASDESVEYWEDLKKDARKEGINLVDAGSLKLVGEGYEFSLADAYGMTVLRRKDGRFGGMVLYTSSAEGLGNAFFEAVYYKALIFVNRYPAFISEIEPAGPLCLKGNISSEQFKKGGKEIDKILKSEAREMTVLLDKDNVQKCEEWVEHNYQLGIKHWSYKKQAELLVSMFKSVLEPEPHYSRKQPVLPYVKEVNEYLSRLETVVEERKMFSKDTGLIKDEAVLRNIKQQLVEAMHILDEIWAGYYHGEGWTLANRLARMVSPRDLQLLHEVIILHKTDKLLGLNNYDHVLYFGEQRNVLWGIVPQYSGTRDEDAFIVSLIEYKHYFKMLSEGLSWKSFEDAMETIVG